ncbi:MAG: hypothetical protein QOF83_1905 [Solirubrobacteraceae bacterium]|jgi:hypothetical protein|nr:hypothetical protein [Solirubrobacteraceae bacterium]
MRRCESVTIVAELGHSDGVGDCLGQPSGEILRIEEPET